MSHRKAKKGFTLIELMVAVGLMGLIIAFSSIIFRYGIDAHRFSSANAEIMQKARAITEQLNSDFRGLRKDAPMMIFFMQDSTNKDPNRYDQIMFFADGDFSSYQQYTNESSNRVPIPVNDANQTAGQIVRGNVARIFYSLAQKTDVLEPMLIDKENRILARRANILSADATLIEWPNVKNITATFGEIVGNYYANDFYEHDSLSIADWKKTTKTENDVIVNICFDYDARKIVVDQRREDTYQKLLCENVKSFAVQWAYWDKNLKGDEELRWFPSDDPDGDRKYTDSHFTANSTGKFGVYFNLDKGTGIGDWHEAHGLKYQGSSIFPSGFYPDALKFTFTVYDSKGIIKGGRMFTHIVYLED
jgi:prepilin-type N-terminal cleavage/methylation domain-containing protein